MSILEILEAHQSSVLGFKCTCGVDSPRTGEAESRPFLGHRQHLAQVLEQHEREREAAVIECLADELAEYRNSHDVAECAAPVEGETGRQACIDRWLEITEDPEVWLREKSLAHHKNGFEYIRGIAYEAWQSGFESGWAEAKDPGAFVNDVWDAKTPNPYTDEEP